MGARFGVNPIWKQYVQEYLAYAVSKWDTGHQACGVQVVSEVPTGLRELHELSVPRAWIRQDSGNSSLAFGTIPDSGQ